MTEKLFKVNDTTFPSWKKIQKKKPFRYFLDLQIVLNYWQYRWLRSRHVVISEGLLTWVLGIITDEPIWNLFLHLEWQKRVFRCFIRKFTIFLFLYLLIKKNSYNYIESRDASPWKLIVLNETLISFLFWGDLLPPRGMSSTHLSTSIKVFDLK